jgi:hypothetical protein
MFVEEMHVDKIPLHLHFKKLAYVALFNKFIHILLKEVIVLIKESSYASAYYTKV